MDENERPLTEVLARLPWFRDLNSTHRGQMLAEIAEHLVTATTREEFTVVLRRWSVVAREDAKWARYRLLRDSGLLAPSRPSDAS